MTGEPRIPTGRAAEIALMERLGQQMDGLARRLGSMEDKLSDIHERVIRLEASSADKEIGRLERTVEVAMKRIDTLERNRDQAQGMASVGAWISRNMPWLIALGAGIAAAFSWMKTG